MDSGRNKRFRSTVHKVDEKRLFNNLAALVAGPVDWAWDGSHFGKPNKNCGADHGQLAKSSPILTHLITEAANGFPDARGVSRVLQSMHVRHGIFNGLALLQDKQLSLCCLDAADNWKKAMYELVQMKRVDARVANPDLQELIDRITLQRPEQPEVGDGVPVDENGYPDFAAAINGSRGRAEDGDDVVFVKERCLCSKCAPQPFQVPDVVPQLNLVGVQEMYGAGLDHDDDVLVSVPASLAASDVVVSVPVSSAVPMPSKRKSTRAVAIDEAHVPSAGAPMPSKRKLTLADSIDESEVHVPSAKRGGQKQPVLKAPPTAPDETAPSIIIPRRILRKSSPAMVVGKIGTKGSKGSGTKVGKARTPLKVGGRNPCAVACVCKLEGPFVLRRRTRPAKLRQHYILDHRKKYVVGCAVSMSQHYDEIVQVILKSLNEGSLACKYAAHKKLFSMVAARMRPTSS